MGTSTQLAAPVGPFKDKLRFELDRQQIGVRTLARKLTVGHPEKLEPVRRRVHKYLSGHTTPLPATRHEIEAALGLERDTLKPDDDEEDALHPLVRDLLHPFAKAIKSEVSRQVAQQLEVAGLSA